MRLSWDKLISFRALCKLFDLNFIFQVGTEDFLQSWWQDQFSYQQATLKEMEIPPTTFHKQERKSNQKFLYSMHKIIHKETLQGFPIYDFPPTPTCSLNFSQKTSPKQKKTKKYKNLLKNENQFLSNV